MFVSSCSKEDLDTHNHPEGLTGEDYYNIHCSDCHKKSGVGKVLEGIPPVYNSSMTHSQMRKFIRTGVYPNAEKHRNIMPVYSNMPKKEARMITRHIDDLFKQRLENR
ncbi:MAG: cytochrome c [Gammaproteobacteria bacterium]|nr:cytochrome c [Gammaproteobacteria bacterium]